MSTTTPVAIPALLTVERPACGLRLGMGVLLIVMTWQYDPAAPSVAVALAVTAVCWSVLMATALRSRLDADQLARLATGSHWYDVGLALAAYLLFLPDPVATPVAALPLLVFRLAVRYALIGLLSGSAIFAALVLIRILLNRVTVGEGLVRPHLLLAWALVALLVLALAVETRARSRELGQPAAPRLLVPEAVVPQALVPQDLVPEAVGNEAVTPAALAPTVEAAAGPAAAVPPAPVEADADPLDTLAASLAHAFTRPQAAATLTHRELEVLVLLGAGHTAASVASRLFISPSTVRNHVHNIRTRLGLADRTELLALAVAVAARSEQPTRARDRVS